MKQHHPFEILLVEDNPGDVRLVDEALRSIGADFRMSVAEDGDEALRRLRAAEHVLPQLVLLDLNLTRVDGRHVLGEIKSDPTLRHIPVVVLTSSDAERDVRMCYDLHVNGYVRKPGNLDAFIDAVAALGRFWILQCELPQR